MACTADAQDASERHGMSARVEQPLLAAGQVRAYDIDVHHLGPALGAAF